MSDQGNDSWLKENHFDKWVGEATAQKLRDELRHLEAKEKAVLDARPDLSNRRHDIRLFVGGPIEKQLHSVVYQAEAIQAELIRREESFSEERESPPQAPSHKKRGRRADPSVQALKKKIIELYKMNRGLKPKELAGLPAVKDNLEITYKKPANAVSKILAEAKEDGLV